MDLATATDLTMWALRRDAQAQLPHLVRRLISATVDELSRLSIRAGDGVSLPGWDGVVAADRRTAFVPDGLSVWEMGVGEPGPKANDDYRKRSEDPGDVEPSTTTFVFVTARRWPGKNAWIAARNSENVWRAVVAYDADDLETWLESAPAVHAWISALLGKDPYEAESLETWWRTWSAATRPPLPSVLFLSGRDREVKELSVVLSGPPGTTSVSADSISEALAFITATLLSQSPVISIERAVIVRTPQAWRQLSVSSPPIVLVPTFERPAIAPPIQSGHHVVIPLDAEVVTARGIRLTRLRRAGIESALCEAGLPRERASTLATLGRRSLPALRRTLAINPDAEIPEWARPTCASDLGPAALVGSWNDAAEGDREALAAVAGRPYEEVARSLQQFLHVPEPPLRRVGDVWMIAAKADTWTLIAHFLSSDDLDRFRRVAIEVLGADDPALELPASQRMLAGLLGRSARHSAHLVGGIADTLALMASTSDHVPLTGSRRGEAEAAIITRTTLDAANQDVSGRRWHSVSDTLPLLAEAAPSDFLQAVEAGSRTADGPVMHLFQDNDRSTYQFSGSPHSSLLWALETLAWSPDHLPRAALRLATLARLEPGGHTLNRPFNSLRDILILWRPATVASFDQRMQVVDLIRMNEPQVAWPLMLSLIPGRRESASPTASPVYRDWKPEELSGVDVAELFRAADALIDRAVTDAGRKGKRWAELLEHVASTSLPGRDRVINALEALPASLLEDGDRTALYRALRGLVNQHRRFSAAKWAMPADVVDRLDALISVFEPVSLTAKHGWLFEQRAIDAFIEYDHEQRRNDLGELQESAFREILARDGFQALTDWAATLPDQQFAALQIGETLARLEYDTAEVISRVVSEREMDRRIALQYVSHLARRRGLTWVVQTLNTIGQAWSPEHKALFLHAVPPSRDVWLFLESLGSETEQHYWANAHPYSFPTRGDEGLLAAEKMARAGQPQAALHLLSIIAHTEPDRIPLRLLADTLELTIRTAFGPFGGQLAQVIGEHLDRLDDAGFDTARLAQLEWSYLPLFRFENRPSRVLHRSLANDPRFFVQVVSLVFRADDEEPRELTDSELFHAECARSLLDSWRHVPGTQPDGTIDPNALSAWVREARALLSDTNRSGIGEQLIGRVLRYAPTPTPRLNTHEMAQATESEVEVDEPDRLDWPAEAIRELIESAVSQHLEKGFELEVYNSRGVTSRALTEGGQQERDLARRYRRFAQTAAIRWPRTSAMLIRIAECYERDAEHHDRAADLTEDTWQ